MHRQLKIRLSTICLEVRGKFVKSKVYKVESGDESVKSKVLKVLKVDTKKSKVYKVESGDESVKSKVHKVYKESIVSIYGQA